MCSKIIKDALKLRPWAKVPAKNLVWATRHMTHPAMFAGSKPREISDARKGSLSLTALP